MDDKDIGKLWTIYTTEPFRLKLARQTDANTIKGRTETGRNWEPVRRKPGVLRNSALRYSRLLPARRFQAAFTFIGAASADI